MLLQRTVSANQLRRLNPILRGLNPFLLTPRMSYHATKKQRTKYRSKRQRVLGSTPEALTRSV